MFLFSYLKAYKYGLYKKVLNIFIKNNLIFDTLLKSIRNKLSPFYLEYKDK